MSEPFSAHGSGNGGSAPAASCARCGRSSPVGVDRCPGCQSWLPGNVGAMTHGLYVKTPPPADVQMSADEVLTGALADCGGAETLTTLERATLAKIRDEEIMLSLLKADIVRCGLHTPNGKVRDSYAAYQAGVDRWLRLVAVVGTQRRSRPVLTLDEYLRRRTAPAAPVAPGPEAA